MINSSYKPARLSEKVNWGKINKPMSEEHFERLYLRMTAYFQGRDIFVQDSSVVADPKYRLPIRVVTENAWHSLFARNLFIRIAPGRTTGTRAGVHHPARPRLPCQP